MLAGHRCRLLPWQGVGCSGARDRRAAPGSGLIGSRFSGKETPLRTTIAVQGAREHNLRNVSVEIPRDQFIVFTGVSGSGKSSLAFDTIYAEGQRRYLES